MIKMSLGMKNELPKRILIIHVARVSHQVFARVGSRVLSRLEFQDQNSQKSKVLTLIKKRYLKKRICTAQLSKYITNIRFESVVVKQLQLVYLNGPKTLKTNYSSVPNRRAYTFISGKVCLLTSIENKRQTLPEINGLFGTLEYCGLMWM